MIAEAILYLVDGQDLTRAQAQATMGDIMIGSATPVQMAAFLTAMRMKGETAEELAGCAIAMRAAAKSVSPEAASLFDTCGTGGDGGGTFNVSTTVAFVLAGMGIPVAKHGNRSVSSQCGSADVLEALGVQIDLDPGQMARCIDVAGIGFLYAPTLHPGMRNVAPVRRELAIRTIFNLLGPLCNPAGVQRQLIGAYSLRAAQRLATALSLLGCEHAWVVHSDDGLDEISPMGVTQVYEVKDTVVRSFELRPEDAGLQSLRYGGLEGRDAMHNASLLEALLEGEPGPRREAVLLNAAACALIAGRAKNLPEGVELARISLDSRAAHSALQSLRAASQGQFLQVLK